MACRRLALVACVVAFAASMSRVLSAQAVTIGSGPDFGTWSIGQAEISLTATGGNGTYAWSVIAGSLPPGLSLRTDKPSFFPPSASAGIIGVATTPGTYTFTLRATSAGQIADLACTLRIVILSGVESQAPDAFVGVPYSYQLHTIGNAGPVLWTNTGTLPAGLNLSATGQIFGTPTASGFGNVNFSVNDGTNTAFSGVNFNIYTVNIAASTLPNATQNAAYNTTVVASGGAGGYTYNASNLPFGLNINPNTGVISGTANVGPGKYNVQVTARDSSNASYNKSMALTVIGAPPMLPMVSPYGSAGIDDCTYGVSCSRGIGVINGGTPPFNWTASGLPPGMAIRSGSGNTVSWISPGDAELWGKPLAVGTYNVQLTVTDGNGKSATNSFPLKVSTLLQTNLLQNGTLGVAYGNLTRVIGGTGPYTMAAIASTLPAGLLPNGAALTVTGTPIESGFFSPRLTFTDSSSQTLSYTNYFNINGAGSGFVNINDGSDLGSATPGQTFFRTLNACCAGSITWSLVSGAPPTGITLSSSGVLSGTTSAASGVYTFVVKAADAANAANYAARQFTLNVTTLNITTNSALPYANINTNYIPAVTLTATGGSGLLTWTLVPSNFSVLPPGMNLSPAGVISGTPTATGQFNFTVKVTDGALQTQTRGFSLSVYGANETPPVSHTRGADMGTYSLGQIETTLGATGGNGTYAFSVVGGTLPPGLAVRMDVPSYFGSFPAGLIGVATTTGTYSFTVRVTSGSQFDDRTFTIKIVALAPRENQAPDAFVGVPYSYQLQAQGNAGPVLWAQNGSLPAGMNLSPSGLISGTPTGGFGNVNFSLNDGTDTVYSFVNFNIYAINIAASTLPNATQNAPYNTTVVASGGAGGYVYGASGLPSGLSINSNNGVISGTVNSGPGKFNIQITARDSSNAFYSKSMAITVIGVPPTLPTVIPYGSAIDDCTLGVPCSRGVGVFNGGTPPFSWTASGLPPGMAIRTGSGSTIWWISPGDAELWGRPTATGNYNVQLTVTDINGKSTTNSFPLKVSTLLQTNLLQNGTLGVAYSNLTRVIGGTGPYTLTQNSGTLAAGLVRNATALTVTGTPTESGSFNPRLTFTDSASQTVTYTNYFNINGAGSGFVNINTGSDLGSATPGQTFFRTLNACCAGSITWSLVSGAPPTGITLSSSGVLSGSTSAASGVYTFIVKAADAANAANYAARQFTINVTTLNITTNSALPYANIQSSYTPVTLTATGGSGGLTWSFVPSNISALPPGITLSAAGVISGTPTATGQFNFTIKVTDGTSQTQTRGFSLSVYGVGETPPVSHTRGADMGTYSIGQIETTLGVAGGNGTYSWSVIGGQLPPGLAVRTDTPSYFPPNWAGVIGVATTTGTYSFTVRVTSGSQFDDRTFTMKIVTLSPTEGWIPDAFVGVPYTYQLHAQGNAGPVFWAPNGPLPAGLNLSPTGLVSGTPQATGGGLDFSLTDGQDTIYNFVSLNISSIAIGPAVLPNATQNASYTATITATGGSGGYTFSTNSIPSGLSLNSSTGVISGTVTSGPGNFNMQVAVRDSSNNGYTRSISLTVIGAPPALPTVVPYGSTGIDDCTIGVPCSRGVSVLNGGTPPFAWTATGLPPGMTVHTGSSITRWWIAPNDAELWGRPTATGTYNVELTVTDGNGQSAKNTFPLKVSALLQTNMLLNGALGAPYATTTRVIGGTGPYTVARTGGSLPIGLTLNSGALVVNGTPAENGFFSPQLTFTDSASRTVSFANNFTIFGAININTGSDLGSVTPGQTFFRTLNACCAGSITWSLVSGAPPAGITLSPSGVLSGSTSAASGVYTFVVKAADSANAANYGARQFTLNVTTLSITTGSPLPFGTVNMSYTPVTLTATGGVGGLTWSLVPNSNSFLPPGMSLSPAGVISGTPTAIGQYTFVAKVTDATSQTQSRFFSLSIYDITGPPLFLNIGPNLGPFSIGRLTVQLAATGGAGGYHYSLTPGAPVIPGMRVQDGPPLPTQFPSNINAGFVGVITTPGTYNTSLRVTDANNVTFDRAITVTMIGMNIVTPNSPPKLTRNVLYSFQVAAYPASGNYSWSASGLPAGLSIDSATGLISGTPATAGVVSPIVTLTDLTTSRAVSQTLTMTVDPFAITTLPVLPSGTVGVPYNPVTLTAPNCGSGCVWSLNTGLAGLSLSPGGVISGTPAFTNNGAVSITATGSNGSVTKIFALRIVNGGPASPLQITNQPFTSTVGNQVGNAVFVSGGTPPYVSWSVVAGALPPGVSLQGPGETLGSLFTPGFRYLIGRAMAVNVYNFTLSVTDSANVTATLPLTWNVSHLSNEYTALPLQNTSLTYGAAYSQQLLALGGTPPYSWSAPTGMPGGLTLSPSGLVNGTPTVVGSLTAPIQVMSSDSPTPFNGAINFTITGARIRGTVTRAGTGAALAGVSVQVFDASGNFVSSTASDASGNYTSIELKSGTYYVRTANSIGLLDQVYNGHPCVNCDVLIGDPVSTAAPNATTINFSLASGGRISGRVTNAATAAGLANIKVDVYDVNERFVGSTFSDASGNYTTSVGLPTGTYFAITSNNQGFIDVLYDGVQCGNSCTSSLATPIPVTQGVITSGINFALPPGGRISGRVTQTVGGGALANVDVAVFDANDQFVTSGSADASGNYITETGLKTGTYYTRTYNGDGYIDKWFNDIVCPGCAASSSTPIAVTAGSTTPNINFSLSVGSRITGRVTAAATGTALSNVQLDIYSATGGFVTSASTDASGNYVSDGGLPSGSYFALAYGPFGYVDQLYHNIACADCNVTTGTPIPVTLPSNTNGINFALVASQALPTVTVGDVSVTEGNSGTTNAVFPVTLTHSSTQAVVVSYATADGTATAGSDYVAASGAVTFAPGETAKQITVLVNGDTIKEANETFFVNLTSASGAIVGDAQGLGTIVNDDDATVTAAPSRVAGGGSVTATFTGGPGNAGDWWGVYLVGDPDTAYKSWGYLNGLHTMPATGLTDATLPIVMPDIAGNYEIRWWRNNALQLIAKTGPIAVATVAVTPTTVNTGGSVTATFTNGPGNPADWWGVYLVGAADNDFKSWGYMNGLLTPPSPGLSNATLPIVMPNAAGTYEIRWWQSGGQILIAKSVPITVRSAATLTVAPTTLNAGASVTATFAGGPGNRGDWWGVYLVGAQDVDYKSWGYLNGQHSMPASGLTDAVLSIAMPGVAGTYEIRWWVNNTLTLIMKSDPITVQSAAPATVDVTPTTVKGGENVTATFSHGPGNPGDWWGVYLVGAPDINYSPWGYLTGTHAMPATGLTDATLPITMPNVPGTYEIRWWQNNSLTSIAKSGPITVQPSATLTVTPSRIGGGGAVTATFAGGPGNPGDWWGVYLVGAPDVDYKSWGYLNGQHTMPGTGLTGAVLPITLPDVAGTYEIRWWLNNGLTLITKSGPITVATVAVTPTTAGIGGNVTTTFTNGPANPGDWWGVYAVGAADTAYLSWGYMNGQQTMPNPGVSGATLPIAMPNVAGTYEIRWWLNNGLQLIAKSPAITVQSAATVTAPATANAGDSVSVTFANGPGNPGDWWGVYLVGAPDGRYLSWGYLNGLHTTPATGLTGATLSIAMPLTPGTYEIRWWLNNGLTPIAKSGPITVVSTTVAAIERSVVLLGEIADAAAQVEVVDHRGGDRITEARAELVVSRMTEVSLQAGKIVEIDHREVVGGIGSDRFVSGAVRHALAEPDAAHRGNVPDCALERGRERAAIRVG